MNQLSTSHATPTLHQRSSSLYNHPVTHDLAQDPNHSLILRSQSSRQPIAPVVQLTSPQPVVKTRNHSRNNPASLLPDVLTNQLVHLKQALQQQNLTFAQKKNLFEKKYTYQAVLGAPEIEQEIEKWRSSLPSNSRPSLRLETWKGYKNTLQNIAAFSAFLQEMRRAFHFDLFHVRFSLTKGIYNSQKIAFIQQRLLPVLLAIQNHPSIAERLFCMAEDGLGACHDRPILTFIDIELETKCFLVLQELEAAHSNANSSSYYFHQSLIDLEAQKYRKQYTVSMLIKAFRDATHGDLDPLQTVVIAYGKIAKETGYFPLLPYRTCVSLVPETEQTERRDHVLKHLKSITKENWQTRLEKHLLTTDNWFKVLSTAFPALPESMHALEETRLKDSEQLIDTNSSVHQTYTLELEAINLTYEKQKAKLFDNPEVKAFTRDQVLNYLDNHHF